MFRTAFSKDTFDEVMTLFFRNLGLVDGQTELIVKELEFDGDVVILSADIDTETLQ